MTATQEEEQGVLTLSLVRSVSVCSCLVLRRMMAEMEEED